MNKTILIGIMVGVVFIGMTTAYAINIQLAGDVIVDGDLSCVDCIDSQDIQDGAITASDITTPLVVVEKPYTVTMNFFTIPATIDWTIVNPGFLSVGNIDFGSGEILDVSEFRKVCMRISSSSTGAESQNIEMGIDGEIFTSRASSNVGTLECLDVVAPDFRVGLSDFDGTESGSKTVELYIYLTS